MDAVTDAVTALKEAQQKAATSLNESGAEVKRSAATAKTAAEEARKVVAGAAEEMKAAAKKMEEATSAHIAATKHKPPTHRSTWAFVFVLSLLVVFQAYVWFSFPKVVVQTVNKPVCGSLQLKPSEDPNEIWVYSEHGSWEKDKEQKVTDESLRDGWCKALIKK